LNEINGFSFNNSKDIEPEIENNIIDKITNRLEFSYSEEINNEDNEMNYEIDKDIEVDEIKETNRLEISYSKEINNETNEIDEIDEANNDNIEINEINNKDAIDEIGEPENLSDLYASEILRFSKKIAYNNIILPTSIQQEKQCLDKIIVQHISFKKVPIVEYEDEIYYLNYHLIFNAIKELLNNENILNYCIFEFTPLYYQGQWIYYEQFNEKW
ncbi:14062_t:CDS:2, partial [Cetraspora pellucida]